MSTESFIFLAIFLLLIVSLFKKNTDAFSPARLFAIVWSFSLLLVSLKLSGLQQNWNFYSWFVVLVSLLSVLLGMFIVYVIKFNNPQQPITDIRNKVLDFRINRQLLFKLIIALFITYIVSYVTIYLVEGYLPFFTAHPSETRTKWGLFGVGLLIHAVPTIVYLVVIYYMKVKGQITRKLILAIIVLISNITYFFLLQRFDLIIFIVLSAIFLYYGTRKFKLKYVLVIAIIFLLIMYGISTIRAGNLFLAYLYVMGKMKISKSLAFLTEPYMYVVMNIENFAHAVHNLSNFSYGYYTFDFILALSGLKHWLADYSHINDFPFLITSDYNTYTMFFAYYRDFGLVGVFIIPTLIGAASSSIYYKMRESPSIATISLYGIVTFVILFSFFIPMLSWLHFVFNIAAIYLSTKFIQKDS